MLNVSGVSLLGFCDSEHMQLNLTAYMLDGSDYRSNKFEVNCCVECRSTSWLIPFYLPMLSIC